jgi:leucyl-tRNA synthetase
MAYNFTTIEKKWQQYWLTNKTFRAFDPAEAGNMPKAYILDMFPYPSGAGLHVGHPEGYTATDIYSRYLRMKGYNVLHPMGWDAFGLPAEQYAIKTGKHPRLTTEENIANFRRQIQMLGLSYDWDREVDTTDPSYYRWTQWIFLQLFNAYFDPADQKAKPIGHLINELQNDNFLVAPDGSIHVNPTQEGLEQISGDASALRHWRELAPEEQRDTIDGQRLAYMDEIPVNWCAGLGTVLANEEVIDGKSEVGGFPVERRPMRQWMLRITAYADRLLNDLGLLDWPDSLKEMQRNWIGKSTGAEVEFALDVAPAAGEQDAPYVTVFTTRPDTLYGATYMVLAPEHPLVDQITTPEQRASVDAYRQQCLAKSDRDRLADAKEKTGVFTGGRAINPISNQSIPVYIADYVMMGYGTGAIMAVPAHDQRDYDFAKKLGIPITVVVAPASPADRPADLNELVAKHAFEEEGVAVNSPIINGLPTAEAKEQMIKALEVENIGVRSVKYKLRDWLFSRQRYWGEPFPILLDDQGDAYALDESELPLMLPEMEDFKPTGTPEAPLSKAKDWISYTEKSGAVFTRETNTMPQWAGSCWYYLRYIDPKNPNAFVDKVKEQYWMPVDLYVGGVEHAVLHLLYARFWHKVLFDLGYASSPEPFQRLVNQGLILGEMEYHVFENAQGPVSAAEVTGVDEEATADGVKLFAFVKATGEKVFGRRLKEEEAEKKGDSYILKGNPAIRLDARSFKMSKSRGNVVTPDSIVRDYGADCLRLYEMYMGPLEAQKPWNTRDIVGMSRFLSAVHRNLLGDEDPEAPTPVAQREPRIAPIPIPEDLDRQMHRTIKKVAEDIESMRFNTAIAELIKLNNELTHLDKVPAELAGNLALMLAPFAPHLAEEIWSRLGHNESLARHAWPLYDNAMLVESTMELPVQVNGKLRDKITVPAGASENTVLETALASEKLKPWLEGKSIRKKLYVANKLVNIVVA